MIKKFRAILKTSRIMTLSLCLVGISLIPLSAYAKSPSLGVLARTYGETFTNKECVDHVAKVMTKIKSPSVKMSVNKNDVFLNDDSLTVDIVCMSETKTIVYIASSNIMKFKELMDLVTVIADAVNVADHE